MTALPTYSSLLSGLDNSVFSLAVDATGNLYAGGDFTTAGGVTANRIAKWDGSTWSALGTGLNNIVDSLAIDASGNLYAGGSFTRADGFSAIRIAKWNGSTWSALGTGLETGLDNIPFSLAFDASGNLYAGGDFRLANGFLVNRIAKWNGSTWSDLGNGLNALVNSLAFDASGNLYAGGLFTIAGGVSANRIAKWDGSTWSALGTGLNDIVYSLAVDATGNLYAGGDFTSAGGVSANRIARWNGSIWSALGTGMNNIVNSLAFDTSGNLYAGGNFTTAGGVSATRIAKWNGSTWSPLGTGLNNNVISLAVDATGNLYAGGAFTTAGGVSANYVCKINQALSGFVVNNGNYTNIDLINIFAPLKPCDHGTFNLNYTTGDFSLNQWFFLYNTINNVKVNAFTKNPSSTANVVTIQFSSNKSYFSFSEPGIYNLMLTLKMTTARAYSSGQNYNFYCKMVHSNSVEILVEDKLNLVDVIYSGNCSNGNGNTSLQTNNQLIIHSPLVSSAIPVSEMEFAVTSQGDAYVNIYSINITFVVQTATIMSPYFVIPQLYQATGVTPLPGLEFSGNWMVNKVSPY